MKEFYYFDEYDKMAEWCNVNNFGIMEVEPDNIGRRFKIFQIPEKSKLSIYSDELSKLKIWFETEYTKLEQKYRRLYTLKLYCDDGSYPYDKLIDLYNDAEYKRDRIKELERLISNEMV